VFADENDGNDEEVEMDLGSASPAAEEHAAPLSPRRSLTSSPETFRNPLLETPLSKVRPSISALLEVSSSDSSGGTEPDQDYLSGLLSPTTMLLSSPATARRLSSLVGSLRPHRSPASQAVRPFSSSASRSSAQSDAPSSAPDDADTSSPPRSGPAPSDTSLTSKVARILHVTETTPPPAGAAHEDSSDESLRETPIKHRSPAPVRVAEDGYSDDSLRDTPVSLRTLPFAPPREVVEPPTPVSGRKIPAPEEAVEPTSAAEAMLAQQGDDYDTTASARLDRQMSSSDEEAVEMLTQAPNGVVSVAVATSRKNTDEDEPTVVPAKADKLHVEAEQHTEPLDVATALQPAAASADTQRDVRMEAGTLPVVASPRQSARASVSREPTPILQLPTPALLPRLPSRSASPAMLARQRSQSATPVGSPVREAAAPAPSLSAASPRSSSIIAAAFHAATRSPAPPSPQATARSVSLTPTTTPWQSAAAFAFGTVSHTSRPTLFTRPTTGISVQQATSPEPAPFDQCPPSPPTPPLPPHLIGIVKLRNELAHRPPSSPPQQVSDRASPDEVDDFDLDGEPLNLAHDDLRIAGPRQPLPRLSPSPAPSAQSVEMEMSDDDQPIDLSALKPPALERRSRTLSVAPAPELEQEVRLGVPSDYTLAYTVHSASGRVTRPPKPRSQCHRSSTSRMYRHDHRRQLKMHRHDPSRPTSRLPQRPPVIPRLQSQVQRDRRSPLRRRPGPLRSGRSAC
jgi:hypothetical protein